MNAPDRLGQTRIARVPQAACGLHVAIFTAGRPIGDDTFRLVAFEGQESMGELFEYNLELHANTDPSGGDSLAFRSVLGRPITVGIALPGGGAGADFAAALQGGGGDRFALFNGIVASFAMEQPGVYRATLRPALWQLGLTNGYRHFSGKSIRDVVGEVLNRYRIEHRFADGVDVASDISVTRIQDWLQAGESDLDLVRRLLGKAHLFYFFEHRGDGHAMVITAGDEAYGQVFADRRPLRYTWTGIDELGSEQDDTLVQYGYQETMTSSHVVGTYVCQDAAWNVDGVAGFQKHPAVSGEGDLPFNQYKVYQYGLSGDEAKALSRTAEQALQSSRSQLTGGSRCARFGVGKLFTVTGSRMAESSPMPVRPSLENEVFVLVSVKHRAGADGSYQNEFQAVPKAPYPGFSLQDTQQGAVLAKVADGAPDDWRYYPRGVFDMQTNVEIDKQGNPATLKAKGVMVQLATGEKMWARLPAHLATAPEVDAMVLVTRANDESELPEISTVCSDGSMVVTPSGWTAHSSVGNNYSTNWGDGKSIRCGAATPNILDQAKSIVENAYASGEYKESSYSRGGAYSYSTSENGRSGLLSRGDSYGNTYSRHTADETKSWSDVLSSYSESLVGDSTSLSTVGTNTSTNSVGTTTSTNTTGGSTSTSTTGMQNDTSAIGLHNSTSAIGLQNSTSAVGVTSSTSAIGLSNSVSVTGATNAVAAVGAQNNVSATGASNAVNTTGLSNAVHMTGVANSTTMTGVNNSSEIVGANTTMRMIGVNNVIDIVAGPVNTFNINLLGPVIDANLNGALILHMDPSQISVHIPALDIQIDVGLELHL